MLGCYPIRFRTWLSRLYGTLGLLGLRYRRPDPDFARVLARRWASGVCTDERRPRGKLGLAEMGGLHDSNRQPGILALQRGPHCLLHFGLRRVLSLRAIPLVLWQRATAALHRHLARLGTTERSAIDPIEGPVGLLAVRAWFDLHPLSGLGLHGRKHARDLLPRTVKNPSPGPPFPRLIC
jgi:hypothetical protein